MTEYVFSIYNLIDKVDKIANAIFRSYTFMNHDDKEEVKQAVKTVLWEKYQVLCEELPVTDDPDQYENAVVRHAVIDECRKLVKVYRPFWSEYYEWEWLKANFDRLMQGRTLPTVAYVDDPFNLKEGCTPRVVVINKGEDAEFADFNEAFSALGANHKRYLAEPELEDAGSHMRLTQNAKVYYGRALRKLHHNMNNIAAERGRKRSKGGTHR